MSYYGYEYFCGANVIVKLEDMPVLECSGIAYQVQDSKQPIYGYSSRHFDTVAQGQVLVSGTLLVNYIHQDYLFRLLQIARNQAPVEENTYNSKAQTPSIEDIAASFGESSTGVTEDLKNRYWGSDDNSTLQVFNDTRNLNDLLGGVDISITFGEQSSLRPNGVTGYLLRAVNFTGHSQSIQISEDVVVEAYEFFARNVYSLRTNYTATALDGAGDVTDNPADTQSISVGDL